MNCPYCCKEIGGYVELGSKEYQRVQQGQCPHCGRSMPSGHTVGFVEQPRYNKKLKLTESEFEKAKGEGIICFWLCLFFTLLGGFALGGLIGKGVVTVGGVIAGIAYFAILFGFAYLWYIFNYKYTIYVTEDDIHSCVYAVFVGIVSITLVVCSCIKYPVLFFTLMQVILGLAIPWIILLILGYIIGKFSKH
ncbi:MAG: hypothetical protein LBU37_13455 [Tannerellaceae bacterium]|jgi:hypothetical protein|nr:hypothetical protein [Tannerellaceae bacterium]